MMIVKKTEPILQQREQELIAMSKRYRQALNIAKETANMPIDEALKIVWDEEGMNYVLSTDSGKKKATEQPFSEGLKKECENMSVGEL